MDAEARKKKRATLIINAKKNLFLYQRELDNNPSSVYYRELVEKTKNYIEDLKSIPIPVETKK